MRPCSLCGESKEVDAFGFRSKATGLRHRRCKTCVAAYGRQHYAAHRATYIQRNHQQSPARIQRLKQQVWDYLAEHPCVDCGQSNPVVLEFDHVDPSTKRDTIYKLVHMAYSWTAINAEIQR